MKLGLLRSDGQYHIIGRISQGSMWAKIPCRRITALVTEFTEIIDDRDELIITAAFCPICASTIPDYISKVRTKISENQVDLFSYPASGIRD